MRAKRTVQGNTIPAPPAASDKITESLGLVVHQVLVDRQPLSLRSADQAYTAIGRWRCRSNSRKGIGEKIMSFESPLIQSLSMFLNGGTAMSEVAPNTSCKCSGTGNGNVCEKNGSGTTNACYKSGSGEYNPCNTSGSGS